MTSFLSELNPPSTVDSSLLPLVTILVPTFNCSQILPLTLDSIIRQNYPRYEILVIDGGSTDRTLELFHAYDLHIRLCSASSYDIYRILNQGIALAKGDYLNILFPGDFYIHPQTLFQMMNLALQQEMPDLIYCGTLLRDRLSEIKFLFRPLTLSLLKRGQQPTSLQACWFKRELFQKIGDFRVDYQLRGGFDLFCRFCLHPSLRYAYLRRAFIDYDLRGVTSSMVIGHFWETSQTLYAYFGGWTVLKWLGRQKSVKRFIKLWFKRLRLAFIDRK
jgi:glycosyltransferase involved in cell wall biosynthesis